MEKDKDVSNQNNFYSVKNYISWYSFVSTCPFFFWK